MIVAGRLLDESGRAVRRSLVEIWQANAAGRYDHPGDTHDAPLDPNFRRHRPHLHRRRRLVPLRHRQAGRLSVGQPQVRVAPAAHPFLAARQRAHPAAGDADVLPGDPLIPIDPVFNSVPDEKARTRMVASLALETGIEGIALGYRFDIVLAGASATPLGM
jgi:protocatechuate 3,4-dioxygenase beta subunit